MTDKDIKAFGILALIISGIVIFTLVIYAIIDISNPGNTVEIPRADAIELGIAEHNPEGNFIWTYKKEEAQ